MQKSLLNFFSKKPNSKNSDSCGLNNPTDLPCASGCPKDNVNEQTQSFNVADELEENSPPPSSSQHKRRRVVFDSSDEEDGNVKKMPIREHTVFSSPCVDRISNFNRQFGRELVNSSPRGSNSPARKSALASPALKNTSLCDSNVTDALNTSIADASFTGSCANDIENEDVDGNWSHLSYSFLQPDRIKDACGRRPSHPEYDSRTLFVPEDFIRKQPPGMRQWWTLKSQNFDTLLFFKMGKFYELYHMDAVISVEELRLSYMRGAHAHTGFPEIAFQRMADRLLHRGHKVARIEQTETPECMAKRTSGRPGMDKVVRREICQVIAPGTWFAPLRNAISGDTSTTTTTTGGGGGGGGGGGLLDFSQVSGTASTCSQHEFTADLSHNRYMLALLEDHERAEHGKSKTIFGVALLKAATGEILIGQFDDDIHYSRLCTLIAHFPLSQVLFERANLKTKLHRMLKARLPEVPFEGLTSGKQFLSSSETISTLESSGYFSLGKSQLGVDDSKASSWPSDLLKMLDPNDPLGRTALPDYDLAVRCLGGVVFYLRYCLADTEILSLGLIREYRPVDGCWIHDSTSSGPFYERQVNMVLDSVTLENLEILASSFNGSMEGTLLERLDTCCTPFGRRQMRSWVVNPPCHPDVIGRRQDAVEELMELASQLHGSREALRRLPDLERLLTKIHIMGWNATRPDHPESRAVLVDEVVYSKKKIIEFLLTLGGFKSAMKIIQDISKIDPKTEFLRSITTLRTKETDGLCDGAYPDYSEQLALFDEAFDHEKARREGLIVVEPGFDSEFDQACADLQEAEQTMEDYLNEQSNIIGCQLCYSGSGKNRFQIEVPDAFVRNVPRHWEATGQRKGFKRFRPSAITEMFARLVIAEDAKQESIQGIMRRLFASFSSKFADWQAAVRCLAELDCLFSLANYSASAAAVTCRPFFQPLNPGTKPFLQIENGFHPCLTNLPGGLGDVTPNDLRLGAEETESGFKRGVTTLLITGPNMGGKSTLMRQTALLTILAHLAGSLYPSPVEAEETESGFKRGVTTLLITGPNMGGKSTLMRQTALLTILAHLGCHIPANSCRLTPVDRIFTRIGASDRLISGQSTFYVELAETAVILNHATPHSLVLVDELGRGTSTRDGSSLAGAVLKRLALTGPLTLFSTHYHSLAASLFDYKQDDRNPTPWTDAIDVGHMDCLVGGEGDDLVKGEVEVDCAAKRVDENSEKITFLYKLVPGACPKSYGFNVAHLAQIPENLISNGISMAKEFEKATLVFSCLRDALSGKMTRQEATTWRSRLAGLSRGNI